MSEAKTVQKKPAYPLDPRRAINMTVQSVGGAVHLSIAKGKKKSETYSLKPGDKLVGFPDPKGEVMLVMRRNKLFDPEMKARSDELQKTLNNIGITFELAPDFEEKMAQLIAVGIGEDWSSPFGILNRRHPPSAGKLKRHQ